MDQEINPQVASIVKALALTENGGKLGAPKEGKSGEMKSLFQFTPGTWKMYSKEILGKDTPLTPESEAEVVYHKVDKWLKDGFDKDQIASIWNSGKPDAYLQDHRGTNKYGVKFDTPGYVKKFNEHLKQSEVGDKQTSPSTKPINPAIQGNFASSQPVASQPTNSGTLPDLMQKNMKQVRQI